MIILVAEDDFALALAIKAELAEAGHSVLGPVVSPEDGLRLAACGLPQLALIDIDLLGHGDGIRLAEELLVRWRVPTVFVSGQVHAARRASDTALGCLKKPFPLGDVSRSVEAVGQVQRDGTCACRPEGLEIFVAG